MKEQLAVITSRKFNRGGGIPTATEQLFKGKYPIFLKEDTDDLLEATKMFEAVMFSGYDKPLEPILEACKARGQKVLVYWHFSVTVLIGDPKHQENWESLTRMAREGKVDLILFCKKNQKEMWEAISTFQKTPAFYILNNVWDAEYRKIAKKDQIGIYSGSGDFWVKNSITNLFAAAMLDMQVDITPLSNELQEMAESLGIKVTGETRLPHEAFMARMASCKIVTYVTFTEACPMTPLECLMNGVLCISGNNHGYYDGYPILQEYLVCKRPDDAFSICQAIKNALAHEDQIFAEFAKWKAEWDKKCHENMAEFERILNKMIG